MNTMKRFVSLALAMAMMFSLLAGCSSKEATTTTAAATEATTAATEAATEKVLTEAEELELMKQEVSHTSHPAVVHLLLGQLTTSATSKNTASRLKFTWLAKAGRKLSAQTPHR